MAIVTKDFEFYDHGTFPVVHSVGEEVTGSVEEFAISQGFAGETDASPAYVAKHRGGGKWDVHGPDGVAVSDLTKDEAKAEADRLNGAE